MVMVRVCGLLALVSLTDGFMAQLSGSCRVKNPEVGLKMGADSGSSDEGSYLSWLAGKVDRARRPAFVKIARARLQRDFAVLLMRSSYQVCKRDKPGFVALLKRIWRACVLKKRMYLKSTCVTLSALHTRSDTRIFVSVTCSPS